MKRLITSLAVVIGTLLLLPNAAHAALTSTPSIQIPLGAGGEKGTLRCPGDLTEVKFEGGSLPGGGTSELTVPGLGTITINRLSSSTFSWVSVGIDVLEVRVKQANDLRVYVYDPPSTADGDLQTTLTSPSTVAGNISHISFCIDRPNVGSSLAERPTVAASVDSGTCEVSVSVANFTGPGPTSVKIYYTTEIPESAPVAAANPLGQFLGTIDLLQSSGSGGPSTFTVPQGATYIWALREGNSGQGGAAYTPIVTGSCPDPTSSPVAPAPPKGKKGSGPLRTVTTAVTESSPTTKAAVALPMLGIAVVAVNQARERRRNRS